MRPHQADIRLLLELYADGELEGAELTEAEQLLETDAAAQEYLLALQEMRAIVALPVEDAAESVSFDGLFARVQDDLDRDVSTIRRTVEMDAKVVQLADGQLHDPVERANVEAYMAAHGAAALAYDAVKEMHGLVRAPVEIAAEQVDFNALSARINQAIDAEIAMAEQVSATASGKAAMRSTESVGLWKRIVRSFGGPAVFASAATAAAVVMIMLPFTRGDGAPGGDPVQIHNHYYNDPAEAVGYEWNSIEKGYDAAFQPGDKVNDIAPVLWITRDGSGAAMPDDGSGDSNQAATPPEFAPDTSL